MKASLAVTCALLVLLGLPAGASAAANKEHQQLLAEIRMLQEQQQQLQQMLGALADSVKSVSAKLDDQAGVYRKAFADQQLQVNGIGEGVRIVREKVDDTNVRILSLGQEIEGLRQAIAAQATAAAPPEGGVPATPGTEPVPTTTAPATGAPPQLPVSNPIPPGVSPQRMYDAAFADYSAGQWELAVEEFETYIRAFPRLPQAAEAQLYIGNTRYQESKWQQAVDAYQKVIGGYSQSPQVPTAYYKMGQTFERTNQMDLARKAYQTVVTTYPNTDAAVLAKQSLDRLNRVK